MSDILHIWRWTPPNSAKARNIQALRLARILGIPPEDVIARWRAGLRWCNTHGWETAEERKARHNTMGELVRRQKEAQQSGLCRVCMIQPLVTKTHCKECQQKHNARLRERYAKKKAEGAK